MVKIRTAAIINAEKKKIKLEKINEKILGPIDWGLHCHLKKYKSYKKDVLHFGNALSFGIGPLAGSAIPGTHRLVFFSRSPLWHGMLNSSMGGAGLALYRAGVDFVAIEGKPKDYYIVGFFDNGKKLEQEFIKFDENDLRCLFFEGYGGRTGVWAVQLLAFDKFYKHFEKNGVYRIISVGPAALKTLMGAIESTVIVNRKLQFGQDDWAGRGGLGSLMLQAHGVVAVAFGGTQDKRKFSKNLKDMNVVNEIYEKVFGSGKKANQVWLETTEKYRYVESIKTGGTFGVNMHDAELWLPSFNWSSIHLGRDRRKQIQENLIVENYLKQFNKEIIETKSWRTCGEPCPVVCKKIHLTKKIDYEPYNAIGPNCGVFDLRYAEDAVELIDTFGFDAIEFGTTASFLLEAISKGMIPSEYLKNGLKSKFDVDEFLKNPIEYSYLHYQLMKIIAYMIVAGHGIGKYFSKDIRSSVKEMDEEMKADGKLLNLAAYIPNGKHGSIAPLQYWVPGIFIPMPIQGKYLTFYGREFMLPEELAKECVKRFADELGTENAGICRFHRKWSEKIVEPLIEAAIGSRVDYKKHSLENARRIVEYNKKAGNRPTFWETEKTKEIIKTFYQDLAADVKNEELDKLIKTFKVDDLKSYWKSVVSGIEKNLGTKL